MTTHYELGEALRAIKIVVTAEGVYVDRKRVSLTSNHTGQRAVAQGEAFAYIDKQLQSVPRSVRPPR